MRTIPYGATIRTSYENFAAMCPHCELENVFNRVTDLGTTEPIGFRAVTCLDASCAKPFKINGDTVSDAYEMLLFDCHELLDQKHYMNCVLSVAQAFEVFFSLFLRVELLYKPFGLDDEQDIEELNRLLVQMAERIKIYTFSKMRSLFLWQLIEGQTPANLNEAATAIAQLPQNVRLPSDARISALGNPPLEKLCKAVRDSAICSFRNRVVHKQAYRPTLAEARAALDEGESLLPILGHRLNLHEDPNWYM